MHQNHAFSACVLLSMLITVAYMRICNADGTTIEDKVVLEKLESTLKIIENQVKTIWDRWQISTYPNFLNSAAISHTSWEVMKLKYQHKILRKLLGLSKDEENTFVVSFMGSSVTAGHDSPMNMSFVSHTQRNMAPSFQELGITFESRNTAMGNNPCLPYDLCPMTFSGGDADIVHWEQSYNCFGHEDSKKDMFEQFIRQCIHMPRRPIVVFSESATPNWREKDCPVKVKSRHQRHLRTNVSPVSPKNYIEVAAATASLSSTSFGQADFAPGWNKDTSSTGISHVEDKRRRLEASILDRQLLTLAGKGEYMTITSEVNPPSIQQEWIPQMKTFHAYQTEAGIQIWSHKHYDSYKCQGPYIPDWGCCSASWHPSLLGHELRAAHHSFYWLIILKEAIAHIKQQIISGTSMRAQLASIDHHIDKEKKHVPVKALYPSMYSDNMKCFTSFEPRGWDDGDIHKYVISSNDGKEVWKEDIFEDFMDKSIVLKAKGIGYLDYKHMLHGNNENTALSIKINIVSDKQGTFFLCEPPGNWGKLPKGFTTLWEGKVQVWITLNVNSAAVEANTWKFEPNAAQQLTYTNRKPKDSQIVCVDFDPYKLPIGQHVISIVATSDDRVMVSTLVLPQ